MRISRSMLWLALAIAVPALAQEDIGKVAGDVRTEVGRSYGSLSTVAGDIHVAANVQADSVDTVSGDLSADAGAKIDEANAVSGNIRLARNVVVDSDLNTVSGDIFADTGSRIGGDISSVTGNIGLVRTEVGGDVTFVAGDVTIGFGSHIKGRVHLKKPTNGSFKRTPRVVIGPDAVVDGTLDFERPVTLYVHSSARTGAVSGAKAIAFDTPSPPKD